MSEDNDPFKEYYEETAGKALNGETASEIIASLEAKADEAAKEKDATAADAKAIRGPINVFIKSMNTLIGKVFREEREKGTRSDLIVTQVIGGLAFTTANVFFLITKHLQSRMSLDEYQEKFQLMFKSAIRVIGKNED